MSESKPEPEGQPEARRSFTEELEEGEGKTTFDVWCVSLIARGGRRPPLTLPHFAFPCDTVSRSGALVLAQQLADKRHLPLRDKVQVP